MGIHIQLMSSPVNDPAYLTLRFKDCKWYMSHRKWVPGTDSNPIQIEGHIVPFRILRPSYGPDISSKVKKLQNYSWQYLFWLFATFRPTITLYQIMTFQDNLLKFLDFWKPTKWNTLYYEKTSLSSPAWKSLYLWSFGQR